MRYLGQRTRPTKLQGLLFIASLGLVMASPDPAAGQDLGSLRNSTVIGGNALGNVSGVASTNMAAGSSNLQSNSGTLATGPSATSNNDLIQQARIDQGIAGMQADTVIQDRAFRQASGWMSVNQAAGLGNLQSNAFGITQGISVSDLSDTSLQQVLASRQGLNGSGGGGSDDVLRTLEIEETAFSGARGVIQVNQSAGTGNATRNSFRFNQLSD